MQQTLSNLGSLDINLGMRQYYCHYNPDVCKAINEATDAQIAAIFAEVTGYSDAKACLTEGSASGCAMTAMSLIPVIGKAGALVKSGNKIDNIVDGVKAFCSFDGDTRVLMADGSTKRIEDIEVGDLVLATDPESGRSEPRRVTRLWIHEDDIVDLKIGNGSVGTTDDHPFWNASEGRWQQAADLEAGDAVLWPDR